MLHTWNKCNFFPEVLFCIFAVHENHKTRVLYYVLLIMVDMKTLLKYKCILTSFMSFVHNRPVGGQYSCDHVHAMEVLATINSN